MFGHNRHVDQALGVIGFCTVICFLFICPDKWPLPKIFLFILLFISIFWYIVPGHALIYGPFLFFEGFVHLLLLPFIIIGSVLSGKYSYSNSDYTPSAYKQVPVPQSIDTPDTGASTQSTEDDPAAEAQDLIIPNLEEHYRVEAAFLRMALICDFIKVLPVLAWYDNLLEKKGMTFEMMDVTRDDLDTPSKVIKLLSKTSRNCENDVPLKTLLAYYNTFLNEDALPEKEMVAKITEVAMAEKVFSKVYYELDWLDVQFCLASLGEHRSIKAVQQDILNYLAGFSEYSSYIPDEIHKNERSVL